MQAAVDGTLNERRTLKEKTSSIDSEQNKETLHKKGSQGNVRDKPLVNSLFSRRNKANLKSILMTDSFARGKPSFQHLKSGCLWESVSGLCLKKTPAQLVSTSGWSRLASSSKENSNIKPIHLLSTTTQAFHNSMFASQHSTFSQLIQPHLFQIRIDLHFLTSILGWNRTDKACLGTPQSWQDVIEARRGISWTYRSRQAQTLVMCQKIRPLHSEKGDEKSIRNLSSKWHVVLFEIVHSYDKAWLHFVSFGECRDGTEPQLMETPMISFMDASGSYASDK